MCLYVDMCRFCGKLWILMMCADCEMLYDEYDFVIWFGRNGTGVWKFPNREVWSWCAPRVMFMMASWRWCWNKVGRCTLRWEPRLIGGRDVNSPSWYVILEVDSSLLWIWVFWNALEFVVSFPLLSYMKLYLFVCLCYFVDHNIMPC